VQTSSEGMVKVARIVLRLINGFSRGFGISKDRRMVLH